MNAAKFKRRDFLKLAAAGGLAASLLPAIRFAAGKTGRRPNIIFFITDDMYPEMLNFLPEGKGKNLTPHLDWLAGNGTVLSNQYVSSPVCTPSRFSVLTGHYASRARNQAFLKFTEENEGQTVIQWNTFVTPQDKTVAHYLKEAGYATGLVGKNHVVEVKEQYHFKDYFADPTDPSIARKVSENYQKVVQAVKQCGFDYADGVYNDNPDFVGLWHLAVHNMDWITDCGLKFIEQNKDRPFFLYFATTVPHDPTEAQRSWNADRRLTAKGVLPEPPGVLPDKRTIPERLKKAGFPTGKGLENVLWLDDSLGALINKLKELDLLNNTIIFFFNDHGQKAKGTLYQGGVHDPSLVWRASGFKVGREMTAFVSNIDFAPTILDLAGISYDAQAFDGRSFKPLLDGSPEPVHQSLYFELGYARAIIKWPYKYLALRYPPHLRAMPLAKRKEILEHYNKRRLYKKMPIVTTDATQPYGHFAAIPGGHYAEHEARGKYPAYFEPDQLYNLEKDPNEQNNLANNLKYAEVLDELKEELRQYLNRLPGRFDL